jgi:hypothetical protein
MLDGSFLHCDKRIQDADKSDVIWFDESRRPLLQAYLSSEAKHYRAALEMTADVIDGFETPFGMELLASVDWLESVDIHAEHTMAATRLMNEANRSTSLS